MVYACFPILRMPLTEEQRARMEENRLKAIRKKEEAKTASNIASKKEQHQPKIDNPSSKPFPSSSTFYSNGSPAASSKPPSSSSSHKKVSPGVCVLVSPDRFVVRSDFHAAAVAAFKTVDSARYDAKERLWSFSVSDHARLAEAVRPLAPDFRLKQLPPWIVKVFGPRGERDRARSRAQLPAEIMDRVEPTLREGLMPFQREGVEFALKRDVS